MSQGNTRGPFAAIVAVRKDEWPLTLLMFGQFFLIITTFWILKPLKKVQFLSYYSERTLDILGASLSGAQAELIAKVANMLVAYVAVVVFSLAARALQRERLVLAFSVFFGLAFVGYSTALGTESAFLAWSFYLFGDLYSTLMVATFFAFLNDSIAPNDARRIYGPVVLGGVAGGAFGTMIVRGFIKQLDVNMWMFICLGIGAVITFFALRAGAAIAKRAEVAPAGELPAADKPAKTSEDGELKPGNPALEGARLVFRSRYLLSIVAIVGLYEVVSTTMDFQFTATAEYYSKQGDIDIGEYISTTYLITNCLALFVQLFLTSFIMSRFPLTIALMTLPLAALGASGAFLLLPIALVGSALNTADNAFSYSVNQSAKEALYTVTSKDEKYRAKAFIDMFVQRFAKAVAVGVSLGITLIFTDFSTVRYLSLFTMAVVALWLLAVRYAGRHFEQLSKSSDAG